MEWINDATACSMKLSKQSAEKIIVVLSTMAPHMASELLEKLLDKQLSDCSWPYADPQYVYEDEIEMPIQVNGKLRNTIRVKKEADQLTIETLACAKINNWLVDKKVIKIIFVKNKLINFVVQ